MPIWQRVDTSAPCWEWTGGKHPRGYGRVRFRGRIRYAHVVVWTMLVGEPPADLEADHLCQNTSCVNPDHLEWVTHRENCRRARPKTEAMFRYRLELRRAA